jgi:hypothetical protein
MVRALNTARFPLLSVWTAMSPRKARRAALAAVLATVLGSTGCTGDQALWRSSGQNPAPGRAQTATALPEQATTVLGAAGAARLAIATSRALYRQAPAVVLVGEDDEASLAGATATAVKLGVPLLLTPRSGAADSGELGTELDRLAVRTVVPVGESAARWTRERPPAASAEPVAIATGGLGDAGLPDVAPAAPLTDLLVLALNHHDQRAAVATARAAGARVLTMRGADPRSDGPVIKALAGQPVDRVLALGGAFGPADRLRHRIDTAATGVVLPGGGQIVFPGRRMVALYGHPGDPRLGVLGEQSVDAAIARAKRLASGYAAFSREPVVPAFEIITTVASSSAGADGDYSSESPIEHLRPWVDAARKAGVYVVLDLQPGHTDFLTQAKRYTELLKQPHVGLALDPEWRLQPGQRHMVQIGSVSAAEINRTADWLAALTRQHRLPQKVLMLHQFRLDMISSRASVRTDHDELRVVIHADGFGTAGQKFNTWNAMHINPPRNVWWGWKNFYDEDLPTFTPRQTMAVKPAPVFVSYQ